MTFKFTGSLIVLDSIEELRHPAAPPALLQSLLRLNENGLWSYGYDVPNGFLVLEGGQSPKGHSPAIPEAIVAFRKSLLEQGVLFDYGDHLDLTQNYEFTSSSVAASVLLARPAEGSTEWKDEYGQETAVRNFRQTSRKQPTTANLGNARQPPISERTGALRGKDDS